MHLAPSPIRYKLSDNLRFCAWLTMNQLKVIIESADNHVM